MTGFETARGYVSVLMDADLQVLPEELPLVLDPIIVNDYEIVCTYNAPERGGKPRGWVSKIGNVFMRVLFNSPVQDAGANFMAIRTHYVRGVQLTHNDQRYLLPISMRRGLTRITEVGTIFGVRGYGRSKYKKWKKALTGFPEMIELKTRLTRGIYDTPPLPEVAPVAEPQIRLLKPAQIQFNTSSLNADQQQAQQAAGSPNTQTWGLYANDTLKGLLSWQMLDWDSTVLERSTGRIRGIWAEGDYPTRRHTLTTLFQHAVSEAAGKGTQLLSVRLPETDQAALHAAETSHFTVIESYLTFARDLNGKPDADTRIRAAHPEDAEAAGQIAYDAFRYNRYFIDPLIPDEQSRQSRREWVINGFNGRPEAVYVAEHDGHIAGFLLLKSQQRADGLKVGIIDLIAVHPDFAGQGLGSGLVTQALIHYHGKADRVEVGTQAQNLGAVNLYIQNGFKLTETALTLHWHAQNRRG